MRTSSSLYNLESNDEFIHLTNLAVQKKSTTFQQFEEGNEASFGELEEAIEARRPGAFAEIRNKLANLTSIVFKSVKHQILLNRNPDHFELFGLDYLIDDDLNVFLVEVNSQPGLKTSKVTEKLIPRMIDDMLKLTVDKMIETEFTEEYEKQYDELFAFDKTPSNENLWMHLLNLNARK